MENDNTQTVNRKIKWCLRKIKKFGEDETGDQLWLSNLIEKVSKTNKISTKDQKQLNLIYGFGDNLRVSSHK